MDTPLSPKSYALFADFLQKKLGIVLGNNRQYLVKSRLSGLLKNSNCADYDALISKLIQQSDIALTNESLELMTTNETFWFRDAYPFDLLQDNILPRLSDSQNTLRVWSSACSTGQEPYSIAMTIANYQKNNPGRFRNVEIVASDFNKRVLTQAKIGSYHEMALSRGLPAYYRQAFFEKIDDKHMQVNATIKSMVRFEQVNLLSSFKALGKFDVIFCRNVLIYFNGKQKTDILLKFAACMSTNAALMLGAAETIGGAEREFTMNSERKGLYYSRL
ncbi:CheR family methyltransferase [Glaciecola petra]|uniref:protein-glutamate O-methyltransferase n=1 Tax=Glaciecola petra TaxID=3075602 RepID=A0ABU2ZQQ0_9ALTE|nr:protein-glutamate O-methyltransferase CheR [Aestuariibacter sp. P117]MDT0593782.1 protein-glutamate O-methyltransferase CheR [Aestuariibacter sp. P117]